MRPGTLLPITAIVSTKNEERAIARCLERLHPFAQIIVVDSQSTDRTQFIAREHGVEVVDFVWNGRYPKKKQWCLDNLTIDHDWVLFVDADEYPAPALYDELASITELGDKAADAYDIPLQYFFVGKELRHGHRVVKRVLLRPSRARYPVLDDLMASGMGELEGHYQPVVDGVVGRTRARLAHDDPDPLSTWVDRHNKYSDWEAYVRNAPALRESIREIRSSQGRIFDRMPLKPMVFFAYSFVLKRGFLDGRAGLDYAVCLAFYYWLIEAKHREALVRNC